MFLSRLRQVGVCESVGSDKTRLLCSTLGEIPRTAGETVRVNGTKAYVPESAWTQIGTVRENVSFGRKLNCPFYENVGESWAMKQDVEMRSNGDLTQAITGKLAQLTSEWPYEGKIELQDLCIRYAPSLPVILKEITYTFPGVKKFGIVGRTGSGKSTFLQALFRVVEPSGGRILIDGVDI
ncbi:YqaJ domain-containing protein [Psidium guajava]|nr:YqaJ domain-containing protein [Psidium guajava]